MLYIVVPTYNRIEICKHFLKDLSHQTYQDFKLVLVDHGKNKVNLNNELDPNKIKLIISDVNGWARAVNVGLRYILEDSHNINDHVLIINDDIILSNDYLAKVAESITEKPDAVLGTCCIDKNKNLTLRVSIKLNRLKAQHIYCYQYINPDQLPLGYIDSDVLTGKGTVFPVEMLRKIGIYAEDKLPHYKADHELVWRAKKNGYDVFSSTKMQLLTLSDQKTANGKESLWETFRFQYFDFRSVLKIKDWWNYAKLAYSFPYAIYFFVMNFLRNNVHILVTYYRTR